MMTSVRDITCHHCVTSLRNDDIMTALIDLNFLSFSSTRETRGTPGCTWTGSRRTAGSPSTPTPASGPGTPPPALASFRPGLLWIFSVLMIAAVMANVAKVSTEHATALCLPSEPYLGQGTTGPGCQAAGPDVIVPSLFPLVHLSLESSCLYVASFNTPAYF